MNYRIHNSYTETYFTWGYRNKEIILKLENKYFYKKTLLGAAMNIADKTRKQVILSLYFIK